MVFTPESRGKRNTNARNYPYQLEQPGRSKKKKGTSTNTGVNGCKGCKCEKSECLKLYCDCFAAGIYCTGPCSCQGCLNTAEYEDTILETKKQIECRDRHAFLPKIVRQPFNAPPSNNRSTPSRARHRRGCNCRKSMCMKNYCECYQANVGCSDGCRCEGCKNVYGNKECHVIAMEQSSPCISSAITPPLSNPESSSSASSSTTEWTNINPQCQEQYVQLLDSYFDVPLEEGIFAATTNHCNYLWQNMLPMENESHNTCTDIFMSSMQLGPPPPEQGLVLQPQGQSSPCSSIANEHSPGSLDLDFDILVEEGIFDSTTNDSDYLWQMLPMENESHGADMSSLLPSLLQQQPNDAEHSDDFMLQQLSEVIMQTQQQQQSSIVHDQQQTPMAMGHQQSMLTAQQQQQQHQHQLIMGPQSNDATNMQVHAPLLGPLNNVDVGDFSQQNNLTDLANLFSELLPYSF